MGAASARTAGSAVGFKLAEGMEIPEELASRFPYFVIKGEY
jgi:hypothetical protein